MWRNVRIIILLAVLAAVANGAWYAKTRAASWAGTLRIVVYPINADQSPVTTAFINAQNSESYRDIEDFIDREANRHGRELTRPVSVALGPEVRAHPPIPPHGGNILDIALWSLRLRYWAWRHDDYRGPKAHIRLYVLYHDPARTQRVPHSLGLEKGMLGVVHAFAANEDKGSNNVVIAPRVIAHARRNGQVRLVEQPPALSGWIRRAGTITTLSAVEGGDHGRTHSDRPSASGSASESD